RAAWRCGHAAFRRSKSNKLQPLPRRRHALPDIRGAGGGTAQSPRVRPLAPWPCPRQARLDPWHAQAAQASRGRAQKIRRKNESRDKPSEQCKTNCGEVGTAFEGRYSKLKPDYLTFSHTRVRTLILPVRGLGDG